MRAFLQGLCGQRLVVQAGQHHQRDAGRRGVRPPHGLQSLCVGQAQVEQDDVNGMLGKMITARPSLMFHDVRQLGIVRALLVEHLAEQAGVSRVVLDQEQQF